MNVYSLSYYFEGAQGFRDIKRATIFASTIEEAKSKWLATEPTALFLDAFCRKLHQ
jgi:hypothetical protein